MPGKEKPLIKAKIILVVKELTLTVPRYRLSQKFPWCGVMPGCNAQSMPRKAIDLGQPCILD